ncbi:MAG: type III secretion system export apparatus subunit SctR [Parvibaculaceae bacterium]|nr:type III secretion system export apparatus subunit SctR [Parvibaculaceae bacterium]
MPETSIAVSNFPDPVILIITLSILGLLPIIVVATTSFIKITVVLSLVRNALGVQQIPPNIALYSLALMISAFIMAPVLSSGVKTFKANPQAFDSPSSFIDTLKQGSDPLNSFLTRHSASAEREFLVGASKKLWPEDMQKEIGTGSFFVLVPAFMMTELTEAFKIGFLLYLPFIVIDLIVSNVLLALGMMMVSPTTISLPLKLLLFVAVDGWTRLIEGLILSYA